MPRTPFGEYLVTRRKSLRPKLTQQDIADRLTAMGHPHTNASVAHWESPNRAVLPDFRDHELVRAIAEILQTNAYKLREVAGFNDASDAPLSPNEAEFNRLFHLLPKERQKLYLQLMESEIKQK